MTCPHSIFGTVHYHYLSLVDYQDETLKLASQQDTLSLVIDRTEEQA